MKIALFMVLLAAGVAVVFSAVSTQCPDNGHFYGATGQTVTASTTTASCVCLDNPPITANCIAPFESNLNGFCVRNPVLTALVVASGETTEQKLIYVGATDEPASSAGFTTQNVDTPRETVFLSTDPSTGSFYGLTNETVLFRYVPTTSSFTQFTTYNTFSVSPSNNEIPQATAFDFDGHYVYVATYKRASSTASIVQVDVNTITTNQVWSQVWAGSLPAPIHHINVFSDSTSHILYAVTGDSIIGINLREQSEHGGYATIHVYSSKLTTGDTATTTNANTTNSSSAITGTTCDSLGNVYFTQAGLTSGTYAIQKILKADVGKSPAPTRTLTSKSAASVTSPVIDKFNNLYWAAGSSSDNLSGVFVCTSVTLTSPICSTSSVYKWPIATQKNGTVVTVTVSQIVYG